MKAPKKLQKQFVDFKAEFVHLCQIFGGVVNQQRDLEFSIPTLWGPLQASIHAPWGFDGDVHPTERKWSSSAIYLRFTDAKGECPLALKGEFNQHSHKWNIHFSTDGPGLYVECCNEALSEFSRRLERATGKKESGVAK